MENVRLEHFGIWSVLREEVKYLQLDQDQRCQHTQAPEE